MKQNEIKKNEILPCAFSHCSGYLLLKKPLIQTMTGKKKKKKKKKKTGKERGK
jgi:hypothetical protein